MADLSAKLLLFARDIKLSHTLFAMPFALLAMFMAARGWPQWGIFVLVVMCMVLARTLAMASNRLFDARLDARNPRTAGRALPAGKLSPRLYRVIIAVCAAGFVVATAGFWHFYNNPWPLRLSEPVLLLLAVYPLLKRFTRLCHFYLGLALGLAPVCASVATSGEFLLVPVILGAAVLYWTAGFDIIYACQDFSSDVALKVHSVPASGGIGKALRIARACHLLSWLLLVLACLDSFQLGWIFGAAVAVAGALLVYEHSLVKEEDLSRLNTAFFTLNGIISAMLGLAGIIDVFC